MALRPSLASTFTIAHAGFNSGTATAVPQIGGPGVPTPQPTGTKFDYQAVDAAAALTVTTGSTFADVSLEAAFDPTLGGTSAKTHQELINLGNAVTKTTITCVSSYPNGSGGFTAWTWTAEVSAASINAAAGAGQLLNVTFTPKSIVSVSFA